MRLRFRDLLAVLFFDACWRTVDGLTVEHKGFGGTVAPNFRPVASSGSPLYRSATLDAISVEAAEGLLLGGADDAPCGRPLGAIIDLRNADEIGKGARDRSEGAELLYERLGRAQTVLGSGGGKTSSSSPSSSTVLYHAPLLGDIEAFWAAVEKTLPPWRASTARLATLFVGGALNDAAARRLEEGGLPLLYSSMLEGCVAGGGGGSSSEGGSVLAGALRVCLREVRSGRAVLFHCQKGKDRTGCLAMLIESVLGASDAAIVESYSASAALLDEQGTASTSSSGSSGNGGLDWSRFRGSPSSAMSKTLAWVRAEYGSVDGYLDRAGFGEDERKELRRELLAAASEPEP